MMQLIGPSPALRFASCLPLPARAGRGATPHIVALRPAGGEKVAEGGMRGVRLVSRDDLLCDLVVEEIAAWIRFEVVACRCFCARAEIPITDREPAAARASS